jgi:LysM repeat protein
MSDIYRTKTILIVFLTALFLSSCAGFGPTPVIPIASPTPVLEITPYSTPTATATLELPTPGISPSATPQPSPTPFTHTIVKGDMLGGIAFQYGLTVDDLLAANPGIDPGLLTIGSSLVVPLEENELLVEATPVPMPIHVEEPDCYPTSDGGAYCILLATNNGELGVENLTVKIGFLSTEGERLVEEIVVTPFNVLPAGESLPMQVYFSDPLETGLIPYGEVTSGFPITEDNSRYSGAEVELDDVVIGPNGIQASAQGVVNLPPGSETPDYIWVAAIAYGENGDVVGMRKWEAPVQESCPDLEAQPTDIASDGLVECLNFEMTVFSLGPEIDRVEVHVEAGYQPDP